MIVFVAGELREYCYFETFNASCQPDDVILMTSAKYGRMRFGRCMKENHRGMGCYADVLTHLDRICSGRNSCDLRIPDQTLHSASNCPKELMMYLEASYTCLKGHTIFNVSLCRCNLTNTACCSSSYLQQFRPRPPTVDLLVFCSCWLLYPHFILVCLSNWAF